MNNFLNYKSSLTTSSSNYLSSNNNQYFAPINNDNDNDNNSSNMHTSSLGAISAKASNNGFVRIKNSYHDNTSSNKNSSGPLRNPLQQANGFTESIDENSLKNETTGVEASEETSNSLFLQLLINTPNKDDTNGCGDISLMNADPTPVNASRSGNGRLNNFDPLLAVEPSSLLAAQSSPFCGDLLQLYSPMTALPGVGGSSSLKSRGSAVPKIGVDGNNDCDNIDDSENGSSLVCRSDQQQSPATSKHNRLDVVNDDYGSKHSKPSSQSNFTNNSIGVNNNPPMSYNPANGRTSFASSGIQNGSAHWGYGRTAEGERFNNGNNGNIISNNGNIISNNVDDVDDDRDSDMDDHNETQNYQKFVVDNLVAMNRLNNINRTVFGNINAANNNTRNESILKDTKISNNIKGGGNNNICHSNVNNDNIPTGNGINDNSDNSGCNGSINSISKSNSFGNKNNNNNNIDRFFYPNNTQQQSNYQNNKFNDASRRTFEEFRPNKPHSRKHSDSPFVSNSNNNNNSVNGVRPKSHQQLMQHRFNNNQGEASEGFEQNNFQNDLLYLAKGVKLDRTNSSSKSFKGSPTKHDLYGLENDSFSSCHQENGTQITNINKTNKDIEQGGKLSERFMTPTNKNNRSLGSDSSRQQQHRAYGTPEATPTAKIRNDVVSPIVERMNFNRPVLNSFGSSKSSVHYPTKRYSAFSRNDPGSSFYQSTSDCNWYVDQRRGRFSPTQSSRYLNGSPMGSEEIATQHSNEEWQTQFFKTKMCPYHLEGRCINGRECRFAHSESEVRTLPDLRKTKLCESYVKKEVCKDQSCPFAHKPSELRTSSHSFFKVTLCNFYKKGRCWNGVHCRFAHGLVEIRSPSELSDSEHLKEMNYADEDLNVIQNKANTVLEEDEREPKDHKNNGLILNKYLGQINQQNNNVGGGTNIEISFSSSSSSSTNASNRRNMGEDVSIGNNSSILSIQKNMLSNSKNDDAIEELNALKNMILNASQYLPQQKGLGQTSHQNVQPYKQELGSSFTQQAPPSPQPYQVLSNIIPDLLQQQQQPHQQQTLQQQQQLQQFLSKQKPTEIAENLAGQLSADVDIAALTLALLSFLQPQPSSYNKHLTDFPSNTTAPGDVNSSDQLLPSCTISQSSASQLTPYVDEPQMIHQQQLLGGGAISSDLSLMKAAPSNSQLDITAPTQTSVNGGGMSDIESSIASSYLASLQEKSLAKSSSRRWPLGVGW